MDAEGGAAARVNRGTGAGTAMATVTAAVTIRYGTTVSSRNQPAVEILELLFVLVQTCS